MMTPLSEAAGGATVNDAAQSATVSGTLAVAESEMPSAAWSNSGSNTGGPLGSAAGLLPSGAIGRPRSGGGDDRTAEITARCFAGMSRGKVADGPVEFSRLS